jgi:ABC-2 type transport system permease protein
MREALYAEWTKLRTLTPTTWLLIVAAALTVGLSAAVVAATNWSTSGLDPTRRALTGIYLGQAIIAVLAVRAISEEYSTGMIRITLTARPRRHILLGAKAATLAGLTLAAGVLAVAGCLLAGHFMMPANGQTPGYALQTSGYALVSITHAATVRAAVGSVLYLALIALLALGMTTAIRDRAASIGVVLALLYLPAILAQVVSDPLRRHIEQIAPMAAGLAIQTTTNLHSHPIAPWAGLGVLAAWAAAAPLAGGLLLRGRDP